MRVGALVCLLFAGIVSFAEEKRYTRFYMLSARATNQDQLDELRDLNDGYTAVFLAEPTTTKLSVFLVRPANVPYVKAVVKAAGMTVTVLSTNVQSRIDAEKRQNLLSRLKQRSQNALPKHDAYYKLWQVNRFMTTFKNVYPSLAVKKRMAKKTFENRPINYMEIGTKGSNKPVIFVEALSHAREWIATASVMYTMEKMLSGYKAGDSRIRNALTKYTWVFVPVLNPDGYVYTWKDDGDRYYRNNRRVFDNNCIGVNLNRNYDAAFGTSGISNECGNDNYPGPKAFSEVETQNVRDLFRRLKRRIVAFVSVHAFSQLLLIPWSHIAEENPKDVPSNINELKRVGNKMMTALKDYKFGTPYQVLKYAASGGSIDWALIDKPDIYTYAYELRPDGVDPIIEDFALGPNEIIPTGKEFMESLLLMAENMK